MVAGDSTGGVKTLRDTAAQVRAIHLQTGPWVMPRNHHAATLIRMAHARLIEAECLFLAASHELLTNGT